MTSGSWIVDDLGRHRRSCTRCHDIIKAHEAKNDSVRGVLASASTPDGLCSEGRRLYNAWRAWCASPD